VKSINPLQQIISTATLSPVEKATVLVEALPYIKKFRGKTIVIKYGGHAIDDERLREAFCRDIVLMKYVGLNPVVVHGGGPQIGQMLDRLQVPSKFVGGMRVTDDETMRIVEMVLAGQVNKELVRLINRVYGRGGRAVGLTGKDGGMVLARKVGKLNAAKHGQPEEWVDVGRVGEVISVDASLVSRLAHDDFIPVIAPIGVDEDGETLNINADPFAAKLAAEVRAEKLMLLTDVRGVKGSDGELCSTLTASQVKALIKSGVIDGGMIPKVRFGLDALAEGVNKVHIIDGRLDHAVLLEIFTDKGIGTELVQE
jgi:acetylglutamate kinase